jgi:hypothetical protein
MIKLEPHEVCPHGDSCGHRDAFLDFETLGCEGLNPDRNCSFVCEFLLEARSSSEDAHSSETHT